MSSLRSPSRPVNPIPAAWQLVFRDGVAPLLSDEALAALAAALRTDDPRLIQGATCVPPPLPCAEDLPCTAACALAYCGWIGEGLATVGEVEEFFARMAFQIDARLGGPAFCRGFFNWFDETPRDEMRPQLLREVAHALVGRRLPALAS